MVAYSSGSPPSIDLLTPIYILKRHSAEKASIAGSGSLERASRKMAAVTNNDSPAYTDFDPPETLPPAYTGFNMLETLPPELQLHIFTYVEYGDALRLHQVSRHFNAMVKPQQWPHESKAKFVQTAQLFAKHNKLRMAIDQHIDGQLMEGAAVIYESNGFACYSCYRVRDVKHFSVRQTRKKLAKDSPNDRKSVTGCGRFCIDCGIAKGVYYSGTRLLIVDIEYLAPDFRAHRRIGDYNVLCGTCTTFNHVDGELLDSAWCDGCDDILVTHATRHDFHQCMPSMGEDNGTRYFRCPQCKFMTMGCDDEERRCKFCKGDLCQSCGCIVDTKGRWWCGRPCSKAAWEFTSTMKEELPPQVQSRYGKIVEKRRRNRQVRAKREKDLFEQPDVVDALGWLSLYETPGNAAYVAGAGGGASEIVSMDSA